MFLQLVSQSTVLTHEEVSQFDQLFATSKKLQYVLDVQNISFRTNLKMAQRPIAYARWPLWNRMVTRKAAIGMMLAQSATVGLAFCHYIWSRNKNTFYYIMKYTPDATLRNSLRGVSPELSWRFWAEWDPHVWNFLASDKCTESKLLYAKEMFSALRAQGSGIFF